jgi:hypothetical protein
MDYLNDIEKAEVVAFLENKVMSNAVKKVLLSGVYFDGTMEAGKEHDPLKNFVLGRLSQQHALMNDNKHLGDLARSMIDAVSMLETGFAELEKCKPVKVEKETKENKGR